MCLKEFDATGEPGPFMIFLRSLSAAKIDEEVHQLEYVPTPFAEGALDDGASEVPKEIQDIQALLEFIECQIDTRTNFEFVQVSIFFLSASANALGVSKGYN